MELLDFARPQPADALAGAVLAELDMTDHPAAGQVARELEAMLSTFAGHPLRAELAEAEQVYRELDFAMEIAPAVLRGQIDVIYREGDIWRIVDYKSDRLEGDEPDEHAARYELQVLLYAAAATGHFGSAPASATLYFLRTGQTFTFDLFEGAIEAARHRAADLAARLIAARRSGRYAPPDESRCGSCRHRDLCTPNTQSESRT
jgi:ATP-dependent exoDNAse (exonuclease V) beta subunit